MCDFGRKGAKTFAHGGTFAPNTQSYVANIVGLCQLSPKIIHAIISGEYPPELSLKNLKKTLPDMWDEQEKTLLGEN